MCARNSSTCPRNYEHTSSNMSTRPQNLSTHSRNLRMRPHMVRQKVHKLKFHAFSKFEHMSPKTSTRPRNSNTHPLNSSTRPRIEAHVLDVRVHILAIRRCTLIWLAKRALSPLFPSSSRNQIKLKLQTSTKFLVCQLSLFYPGRPA